MFGPKSAQGRAVLAGMVLVVLLASIATLAVWRTRDMQQQHHALEHASATASALEHAHAQFWEAQATLSALILLGDPSLADTYHDTVASLEQSLSQARTQALAEGEADEVLALDALAERIGHFTEQVSLALPVVLEADPETRAQLATASMAAMVSEAEVIVADLEETSHEHQQMFAASRASAGRAADTTLWLLIGFSAAAFLVAAGTVAMLIVSVVRPLTSLRASARAITAGDPEARAKVHGPEEVASLARDLNEMTDALLTRTQEREKALHAMGERMKELACIYRVTDLARADKSIEELLQDAATVIPSGWQHPQITRAKVSFDGHEYVSEPFQETPWKQSTDIVIRGEKRGAVQVYYLEQRPELDEGPFTQEERNLIDGIARVLSDAAERKRAEEALRESEERTRLIIETAQDAFISIDARGVITAWNAQAERTFGCPRSQAIGRTLADTIIPPQHRQAYERGLERFLATGKGPVLNKTIEITAWHHDGHEFPVELAVWAVRSGDTYTFNAFVRDISERKRAEEERARLHAELEVRAITDGLTGLYNHAHFFQRLAEEIERSTRYGRSFSILMMDVDSFKRYNDTRGHQAGDDALRLIADSLRKGVRRSDTAFRYGGDEFAAILLHADSSRAQAIAKRVSKLVASGLKATHDPAAAWLGVSAGIACFPADGATADELVRIADAALYDAKRAAQARRPAERAPAAAQLAAARAPAPRKE